MTSTRNVIDHISAHWARLGALLGVALVLAACQSVPPANLIKPVLGFQAFEVKSLGFENIAFALTIRADNPNKVAIPVNDLTFDLDLLGKAFASGKSQQSRVELPANGSRDMKVDFVVPTRRFIQTLREMQTVKLDDLGYALRGSGRWGAGDVALPFERKGSLDLLREFQELMSPITGAGKP